MTKDCPKCGKKEKRLSKAPEVLNGYMGMRKIQYKLKAQNPHKYYLWETPEEGMGFGSHKVTASHMYFDDDIKGVPKDIWMVQCLAPMFGDRSLVASTAYFYTEEDVFKGVKQDPGAIFVAKNRIPDEVLKKWAKLIDKKKK